MEEPFLNENINEAQSRLEDIRREIRFFSSDLEQLTEYQEELIEENKFPPEGEEKIREGKSAIKSIQILINDFKNDFTDFTNWDEFKRSEREFKELVDEFINLTDPSQHKQSRRYSSDDEDEFMQDQYMSSQQQQVCIIEEKQISVHKIMDLEDIVKERGERINNINRDAIAVNSLATEINHQLYDSSNIIENIVKNTFDANQNLLKGNKELEHANNRAMTRRNFCLRLVVTLALTMLIIGFFVTKGYFLLNLVGL